MQKLPRGNVLHRFWCPLLHPLRCGILQRRGRHLLRVHRVHVPRGHVRKRYRRVRAVLARHRVHRSRAVHAAAVLLEREHAGWEWGGGVGGRAGHGGGVQWTVWCVGGPVVAKCVRWRF